MSDPFMYSESKSLGTSAHIAHLLQGAWQPLTAPATTVKLRSAVGDFCVADMLEAALQRKDGDAAAHPAAATAGGQQPESTLAAGSGGGGDGSSSPPWSSAESTASSKRRASTDSWEAL